MRNQFFVFDFLFDFYSVRWSTATPACSKLGTMGMKIAADMSQNSCNSWLQYTVTAVNILNFGQMTFFVKRSISR